jgi:CBS-domain-containing membrane protein
MFSIRAWRPVMKVSEIMTRRVVTATADDTIEEIARLMLRHRVSGLPVIGDGGAVIGMVSEGDLLRRAEIGTERRRPRWLEFIVGPGRLAEEYVHSHARRVGDIMTAKVVSIAPETPLEDAVALMERHRIKRLPVVKDRQIVGIVSRADLLRAVANLLGRPARRRISDAQIRKGILAEIDKQPWAPRASLNVAVKHGVVELHGAIADERERQALRVIVENFPGVTGVRDHLVWVEPVSGMVLDTSMQGASSGPATNG